MKDEFLLDMHGWSGSPTGPSAAGKLLSLPITLLEEASTHKSAKTHAGTVFVTRDLDLWPFDPKINGFPGLIEYLVYNINVRWLKTFIRNHVTYSQVGFE